MDRRRLLLLALVAASAVAGAVWLLRPAPPPASRWTGPGGETVLAPVVLTGPDLLRQQALAGLAILPGAPFPAALPWAPTHEVGSRGGGPLAYLAFLELCLRHTEREIHGYRLTFLKRERVGGKLQPAEKVAIAYRDRPFSVRMHWQEGARLAQKVLYVAGENNNKVLARPAGRFLSALVVSRDVDGPDARQSGRYTIAEFGLRQAMERSVAAMQKAAARGALHVRYDGLVTLPEVGDRPCHKFVRTPYTPPEEDGVNELTIYVDRATGLQVGSVLKDSAGELIGEYFFRDIELDPPFAEKEFTRGAI